VAAVVVTAGLLVVVRRRVAVGSGAALCGAGAAVAAAALLALSWSGHASTGKDRTANMVIDALHNLATAAWLGGWLPWSPCCRRSRVVLTVPTGCACRRRWWCGSRGWGGGGGRAGRDGGVPGACRAG